MSKLKIINIDKLPKSSLQKGSYWENGEIRGLNRFLSRIENGLNKTINKEIKNGKKLEEIKSITAIGIKAYPFKFDGRVREQFYNILKKYNININKEYFNDMTFSAMILNFLSPEGGMATKMCDVTLDIEKTLKKVK